MVNYTSNEPTKEQEKDRQRRKAEAESRGGKQRRKAEAESRGRKQRPEQRPKVKAAEEARRGKKDEERRFKGWEDVRWLNEILTQEKSIYIQIKEMVENDILRDILMEEERVPSTNELAKLYAINPATAGKGINLLVDEGILYKKRGIGMFVAAGAKERIMMKRKEHFYEDYVQSLLTEARRLGISKRELAEMIEQVREGEPEDE